MDKIATIMFVNTKPNLADAAEQGCIRTQLETSVSQHTTTAMSD